MANQSNQTPAVPEFIQQTILKAAIESIPLLNSDNYSVWLNWFKNVLYIQNIRTNLVSTDGVLSETDNLIIRTLLTSKIDSSIQLNLINNDNTRDAKAIWKNITKYFASTEACNRARVYWDFHHMTFDSNISAFITNAKTKIGCLQEVGIEIPLNIIAYVL